MPPAGPTLSAEQIADIVERRHAALLEKYIHGKASPTEIAEIAHIIAQLPGPATPENAGKPFSLSPEAPAPKRRTGYEHEIAFYADRYKSDQRSVKRWISDGRSSQPPDLCPLDVPAEMPAWWQRRMNRRPPQKILDAANAAAEAPVAAIPKSALPPVAARDWSSVAEESLTEQVAQFRRTVSISGHLLQEALTASPPDEALISSRQRTYERSLEQLRKLETTDQATRIASGELVRKADVITDLATLLHSLATMRKAMAERVVETLPWLSGDQRLQVAASIETVRLREDELLRSAEKWSPVELPQLLGDR